ncbi:MAG: ABC transporter permease, partial [Dehalococcoidia bacterium]
MDVAYTLRRLRRQPTYAALTVLTLALGVAGTAAVYAVAERLLWEPLPVPADEEVALFWAGGSWTPQEFLYLRPQLEGFQSVAAFWRTDVTFRSGDAPARAVDALSTSAELLRVLGVSPVMGPGFRPGDDSPESGRVAVLSHAVWQELGGDPSIIGQRIEFSGAAHTVVGVMPAGFWFPDPAVGVWLSASLNPEDAVMNYQIIGRLPAGTRIEAMAPHVERITALLGDRFTYREQWDKTQGAELTPLRDHLVGQLRPALQALLGAMVLLLLIACVNVAALMLGQVDSRGTELAVRSALGAARPRLLRQLAVEAIVIGMLAGLVGTALAIPGFQFLVSALPLGALAETATVDGSLLWVAIGIAVLAATAVAMVPALSVSGGDLRGQLVRNGTRGVVGRGGRLEGGLVVGQVALVLLMAAGAALLIRSVANLRAIDAGVETAGVGVIDVVTPFTVAPEDRRRMLREALAAVDGLSGVGSAAATQRLPLRGGGNNWGIRVEQRPELEA